LGLKQEENSANHISKLDGVMQMLIQMRNQARADKNWALSDQIRDELLKLGIQLKDGKDGTDYRLE
jgi:cysteinyl-tRNA synthetase